MPVEEREVPRTHHFVAAEVRISATSRRRIGAMRTGCGGDARSGAAPVAGCRVNSTTGIAGVASPWAVAHVVKRTRPERRRMARKREQSGRGGEGGAQRPAWTEFFLARFRARSVLRRGGKFFGKDFRARWQGSGFQSVWCFEMRRNAHLAREISRKSPKHHVFHAKRRPSHHKAALQGRQTTHAAKNRAKNEARGAKNGVTRDKPLFERSSAPFFPPKTAAAIRLDDFPPPALPVAAAALCAAARCAARGDITASRDLPCCPRPRPRAALALLLRRGRGDAGRHCAADPAGRRWPRRV